MKKNVTHVTFVIHPTEYEDYDVLAIGNYQLLAEMSHKNKNYQLILKSKFGGIPILVVDTCNTLKDAANCIKTLNKQK
jgi:hypothetical protein